MASTEFAVSKTFASSQIKRLKSLAFYEKLGTEGVQELAWTLQRAAKSEEMAVRMISGWLDSHTELPTPANLHGLAQAERDSEASGDSLPAGCADCRILSVYGYKELNFRRRNYTRMCPVQHVPVEYEGQERCSCTRGLALRERDRINAEETGRRK